MHLLPVPQTCQWHDGIVSVSSVYVCDLPTALPPFVKAALMSLFGEQSGSVPCRVACGEERDSEDYALQITTEEVLIAVAGYKGVYYAVQTLRQLCRDGVLPCVDITDAPDYRYRGFYQDVSRGRIPTVETVKRLVDRLSALKMNSLQLYVEHTHRFAEYVGINDELGYYTDEEIRDIDRYCVEHGVELIPSLSSFGHLYALLQSETYRHLCELSDYQPTAHNWHERLLHHTIDPSSPESVALITSLIAQYEPLFTSSCFNICCDETFDLCKGKNAGGEVGAQYAAFVSKLVTFLQERGKTVMMWSDIVMKHPETLSLLPEGIVYLNWCYDMNANGLNAERLAENGCTQIVCPSVHSHKRLVEKIVYNRPNIQNVLEQGRCHGAVGVLNTNWGDYGHLCFDEGMLYGLAYGAAKAWNVDGTDNDAFDEAVCRLVYGTPTTEVLEILKTLGACDEIWFEREGYEMALWELVVQMFDRTSGVPADFDYRLSVLRANDLDGKRQAAKRCAAQLRDMLADSTLAQDIGEALAVAADGIAMLFGVLKEHADGNRTAALSQERDAWIADMKRLWHQRNKAGEWETLEAFVSSL